MTLEDAIRKNPYEPNKGNLSAYCRYLRYNVDGFYTKTNDEVKKIFKDYTGKERTNMADIELVIKIPEELKNKIDNANEDNYKTYLWWFETTLYCAIKNGTPLSEELEKIKAEFEDKILLNQTVAIQIIEKHIAELKGENKKECSTCKSDYSHKNCLGCIEYGHWEAKRDNKQSRCNSCQNNTDELSGECYECVKGIKDNYIAELKGEN